MFITKRLKQWRLLRSELNASEQYEQFLELVKADLEDLPDVQAGRKHLFMGRPAFSYWTGQTKRKKSFIEIKIKRLTSVMIIVNYQTILN